MAPALNHQSAPLDRILVIDDLPIIPVAFQEIFRSINPSAVIEYSENIFSALSSKAYASATFDLVIAGSLPDNFSEHLQQAVTELRKKFGEPRIMIYSSSYDPVIIEKMDAAGIDAYVHKYESVEEIRKAYGRLAQGMSYVSEIFHTLKASYPAYPPFS